VLRSVGGLRLSGGLARWRAIALHPRRNGAKVSGRDGRSSDLSRNICFDRMAAPFGIASAPATESLRTQTGAGQLRRSGAMLSDQGETQPHEQV